MFGLRFKLYLLLIIFFGLIYAVVSVIGYAIGIKSFYFYLLLALVFLFIQYMIGPNIVELMMNVRYVDKSQEPWLHEVVEELSSKAGIPKPKIGIAEINIPNAFAFGRSLGDGRVCVTRGILRLLNRDELKAVLGHEISHLKNRDVMFITLLSVLPLVLYLIARNLIFMGMFERRDERSSGNLPLVLVGFLSFILYFITNLLVLYASRIREYFADTGSVSLGSRPIHLASALYKLAYGSAKVDREELRQYEGIKAFFLNDPSKALKEIRELREIDINLSGKIEEDELLALRNKKVKLSFTDKLFELLSTHPNMLKRIKYLSQIERGMA
ncbi:MAG: M48 family metalloprotease [Candidatus Hydrothermales bacterium]